ncbi:MAG TPA: hypothetical protein VIG95_05820 [Gemmatimonadales bacterium]|jgi:hypothetical protein
MKYSTTWMTTLMTIVAVSRVPTLQAQSPKTEWANDTASRLAARSRERAIEWIEAKPVIHCAPAPLTESPSAADEAARPHLAPLEEAFLDAAIVRGEVAARSPTAVTRP